MKEILISALIIAIIFSFGIVVQKYLKNTGNEITEELIKLKKLIIEDKNNAEIQECANSILNKWNKIEEIWATIIMHEELDNIEVSLISLKAQIENGKKQEAMEEIDKSKFWIKHIEEKEAIKIKNIFQKKTYPINILIYKNEKNEKK